MYSDIFQIEGRINTQIEGLHQYGREHEAKNSFIWLEFANSHILVKWGNASSALTSFRTWRGIHRKWTKLGIINIPIQLPSCVVVCNHGWLQPTGQPVATMYPIIHSTRYPYAKSEGAKHLHRTTCARSNNLVLLLVTIKNEQTGRLCFFMLMIDLSLAISHKKISVDFQAKITSRAWEFVVDSSWSTYLGKCFHMASTLHQWMQAIQSMYGPSRRWCQAWFCVLLLRLGCTAGTPCICST